MRPRVAVVVVGLLALALLAGCGSSSPAQIGSGPSETVNPAAVAPDQSLEAAQNKLRLAEADPCYTSADPRAVWPRCGRWVEETTSTSRTAASARPDDAAVTAAAAAVGAAHDTYGARGCPATGPAVPLDANVCIGALLEVRSAVARLGQALGPPS